MQKRDRGPAEIKCIHVHIRGDQYFTGIIQITIIVHHLRQCCYSAWCILQCITERVYLRWIDEWLITLDVHHRIISITTDDLQRFITTIGTARMIGACHHSFATKIDHVIKYPRIVGSHYDLLKRSGQPCLLGNANDHALSTDVHQWFSWQAGAGITRWYYPNDPHRSTIICTW